MKKISSIILIVVVFACNTKDKYDINRYYTPKEQDAILTSIIAYIYTAPLYSKMEDRFEPKHRQYYSSLTSKFKIIKYYVADDSTHFFYLLRPSSIASEHRVVAGHFKLKKNFGLKDFREEFVTTVMPESDLTGKSVFLFDEMVKGKITDYLGMETYIQWPNKISYYDTITYEWKLIPGSIE